MGNNNMLSRQARGGTEEQKLALETTSSSLDNLNEEVSQMAEGIMWISETSQSIHDDALEVLSMSEDAFDKF
jgi:methyl-accepting chemotaxis protein